MTELHKWFISTGLAVVFLLTAGGCAQDVGDIDRTQPDKIDKSIFKNNDEWYFQQTVVDTSIQNPGPAFKGLQGSLKRIRWKITEDTLFAYSAVAQAEGLYEGERSEEDLQLSAVAAFPITSHFDVQRQYNPRTGEPSNVIVENRSDRQWFNREYMRVDWTRNLVDGQGTFGSQIGRLAATAYNPPQQDDHVDPNRTVISDDYIDVTVQYSFFPDLQACRSFLGMQAALYCNGGKIKVRNSFKKVDTEENQDYIPMEYLDTKKLSKNGQENGSMLMTANVTDGTLGQRFQAVCDNHTADHMLQRDGSTTESCSPETFSYNGRYGFFRTRRTEYDQRRPNSDADRDYFANRWPIWQDYHVQPKHHENGQFTDMEIGDVIPMSERTPKPIVFHLNARYPKDMIKAAKMVEEGWDEAFKETVALAKFSGADGSAGMSNSELHSQISAVTDLLKQQYNGDGRMFKIERNSCHPQKLVAWKNNHGTPHSADRKNIQRIFDQAVGSASGQSLTEKLWEIPTESRLQLCADLEWATAERGDAEARYTWEQLGDLRYSFFTWFREDVPWAGYGPLSADPKTGRIISAAANGAGSYYRDYVPYYADIIKYINGELSADDIEYGKHVRKSLKQAEQQQQQQLQQLHDGDLIDRDLQKELARRTETSPSKLDEMDFGDTPTKFSELPGVLKHHGIEEIQKEADRKSMANMRANQMDTRAEAFFQQPDVKNMLMQDAQFQRMVRATAAEKYGKMGPNSSLTEQEIHQAYLDMTNPQRMLNRQKQSERFMAQQNMLAASHLERAFEGLITLEGVAEAFKGMSRKELERYLMNNAFAGTMLHEVGHTVGLRHNFSASRDPLNYHDEFWKLQEDILLGNMSESEARSVTGNKAAEVTGNENVKYLSIEETKQASIMDYSADIVGRFHGLGKYDQAAINFAYARHVEQWKSGVELPNLKDLNVFLQEYTTLPAIFAGEPSAYGGDTGVDPSEASGVVEEGIDNILNGRQWVPIRKAISDRREGIRSNSQNWKDDVFLSEEDTDPYIGRTVNYEYCSDEFRGGILGCEVFDHGANNSEAVNYQFNRYRLMQPFWRYKGQENVTTAQLVREYQMNALRTMQAAQNPFRYYAYYQWLDLDNLTDDLQRASIDAFNFYGEVMATPEPGRYCMYEEQNVATSPNWYYEFTVDDSDDAGAFIPANPYTWHTQGGDCENYIDIAQGTGYPYDYEFTDEYLYRVRRVGTYVDKTLATLSMFNVNANFAQSSFVTDQRATYLSYWTIFKDEMLKFLRGTIIGDYNGFAGVYAGPEKGYQPPQLVSVETFEKGAKDPQRNMPRIRSRLSFNHQFNSLAYAMIQNNSFQDRAIDFNQYVKVAVTNDELQPYPDSKEIVKFTHPTTGQIYHAPQIEGDQSVAADLIRWAKAIKPDLEQAKEDLKNAERGTDNYNTIWRRKRTLEDQLQEVTSKLNMVRFLNERLGGDALR